MKKKQAVVKPKGGTSKAAETKLESSPERSPLRKRLRASIVDKQKCYRKINTG